MYGGSVPAASSPITPHGSLQASVASTRASDSKAQANGNRRTLDGNVATAVSRYNKPASGNSGALNSSITR